MWDVLDQYVCRVRACSNVIQHPFSKRNGRGRKDLVPSLRLFRSTLGDWPVICSVPANARTSIFKFTARGDDYHTSFSKTSWPAFPPFLFRQCTRQGCLSLGNHFMIRLSALGLACYAGALTLVCSEVRETLSFLSVCSTSSQSPTYRAWDALKMNKS